MDRDLAVEIKTKLLIQLKSGLIGWNKISLQVLLRRKENVVGSVESCRMLCCGLYIPVCDVARIIQWSVWGVPWWTESMWCFGYKNSNSWRFPVRRTKLSLIRDRVVEICVYYFNGSFIIKFEKPCIGGSDLSSECVPEPEFIQSRPSVLAAASIGAAVRGLNSPSAASALTSVCLLTHVDPAAAEHVLCHIERVVASETASLQVLPPTTNNSKVANSASCSAKLMSVADETGQPETPTDVQDVHFWKIRTLTTWELTRVWASLWLFAASFKLILSWRRQISTFKCPYITF